MPSDTINALSYDRRMVILRNLRSYCVMNYLFQLFLRNFWCNLHNLLCNFMHFLFLTNLEKLRIVN